MAIATANEVSLEFLEAFGAAWNRHDVARAMDRSISNVGRLFRLPRSD